MNREVKFRSTLGGGYKKEDVNEYITSMQAQFTSIEDTLKNTINHQKEELDSIRAAIEENDSLKQQLDTQRAMLDNTVAELASCREALNAEQTAHADAEKRVAEAEARVSAADIRAAAMEAKVSEAETRVSEAESQMQALTQELDDLRARCAAIDDENTALTAQLQALKTDAELAKADDIRTLDVTTSENGETVPKAETENPAETPVAVPEVQTVTVYPDDYEALKLKAEQYDRMSAHVGAIMLKANANAEELVQKARREAETMLSGVNAELSATRTKAQSDADTLIDGIHDRVVDINATCHEDILVDLEEIRGALVSMMDAVQAKYAEIDKKIVYAKDEMDAAAKEIINRATAQRVLKK